jgi:hypothetical protein
MTMFGGQRNDFLRTLSILTALRSLAWLVLVLQWLRGNKERTRAPRFSQARSHQA